jgi:hypothetical protein
MWRFICAGTNVVGGARVGAESDALGMARTLAELRAPSDRVVIDLVAGWALTRARLERALCPEGAPPAGYALVYLAAPGRTAGILLADGFYSFARMARVIRSMASRRTLVVLDAELPGTVLQCRTALAALIEVPGVTVLASRRGSEPCSPSDGAGAGAYTGGTLTTLLCQGLRTDSADLQGSWMSEARAVSSAATRLVRRGGPMPVVVGVTGDLPLVPARPAARRPAPLAPPPLSAPLGLGTGPSPARSDAGRSRPEVNASPPGAGGRRPAS